MGIKYGRGWGGFRGDLYSQESTFPLVINFIMNIKFCIYCEKAVTWWGVIEKTPTEESLGRIVCYILYCVCVCMNCDYYYLTSLIADILNINIVNCVWK